MSKLKDYKDKIKGWPEKKECEICGATDLSDHAPRCGSSKRSYREAAFNQALDLIGNLEFNPATMVELDVDKIAEKISNEMRSTSFVDVYYHSKKAAQAIVKAKLEIVK